MSNEKSKSKTATEEDYRAEIHRLVDEVKGIDKLIKIKTVMDVLCKQKWR